MDSLQWGNSEPTLDPNQSSALFTKPASPLLKPYAPRPKLAPLAPTVPFMTARDGHVERCGEGPYSPVAQVSQWLEDTVFPSPNITN